MKEARPNPLKTDRAVVATDATYEEYLEIERRSEIRHEYYKGRVTAMAGTTPMHNELCFNIKQALNKTLSKRGCQIYMENVKLQIRHRDDYVYPDVFVVCRPVDMFNADGLTDPVAIFEVLSESTKRKDRNDKFERCRQIETLRHYVLADQYKAEVEHRRRAPFGGWTTESLASLDDTLTLDAFAAELKLADIYEDISWDDQ